MRVCYFGAFNPSYARNNLLRRALTLAGAEVVTCNVPPAWPTLRKAPALTAQYARVAGGCDVILVAEFGQTLVPLAVALGRLTRRPVAFDLFISLYEANIFERQRFAPGSPQARRYFRIDQLSGKLPDALLIQTGALEDYLVETFGLDRAKMIRTPLGVNDALFTPLDAPTPPGDALRVLYFGSYIPNHGVDVILRAADALRDDERLRFRFVGDGEGKPAAVGMAERLGLPNVEFAPRVPFEDLPREIAAADIVLGPYGDTPQARKLMANKVSQGLAMRRLVLAGDTLSIREHFTDHKHLWLTPLGDSAALADALTTLAERPALREQIAAAGHARFKQRLTPAVIGPDLVRALEGVIATRRG